MLHVTTRTNRLPTPFLSRVSVGIKFETISQTGETFKISFECYVCTVNLTLNIKPQKGP